MLDIKGKCDPRMYNFDSYRRTKSTLQEHNGVDYQINLLERIYVTPRFYGDSGIRYIKDNELNPSFISEQNCYRRKVRFENSTKGIEQTTKTMVGILGARQNETNALDLDMRPKRSISKLAVAKLVDKVFSNCTSLKQIGFIESLSELIVGSPKTLGRF